MVRTSRHLPFMKLAVGFGMMSTTTLILASGVCHFVCIVQINQLSAGLAVGPALISLELFTIDKKRYR